MTTRYGFHPDALFEYAEATRYYLREASIIAVRFSSTRQRLHFRMDG